ncbi:PREDICTED: ABC transporter B family member 25-like isoform X2 [Priapulus caudatus]|uniref:ABC transporter B family member 25-like isoform X2 n=1 Tax=Priapulus caudatus TaxID=37621 RepID=A0ABM1DUY1_PRICU|nr:PREDICTED: ABC transporter B family member 25-like isoform X2 [Priapulus caudatus]
MAANKLTKQSERVAFAKDLSFPKYKSTESLSYGSVDHTVEPVEAHEDAHTSFEPTQEENKLLPSGCSIRYSLPLARFTVLTTLLLFVDCIVTAVLWFTGGSGEYLTDSVINFSFETSIFDLLPLAIVRTLILVSIYWKLESTYMQQYESPLDYQLFLVKRVLHASAGAVQLVFTAYAFIKGGMILAAFVRSSKSAAMSATFYAALVCACVFSLAELLAYVLSFRTYKKLPKMRVRHIYNAVGVEVDVDGTPKKREASLVRIAVLAKPEFPLLSVGLFALLFSSGSQIVAPLFFGLVIDAAQTSIAKLNRVVVIMLLIYGVGALASMIRAWMFELAGQRFVARLRKDVFTAIIKQEIGFFDETRTGELTNRLASDTQVVQNAVTVNISMLVRYTFQIIGSLVLMFLLSAKLTAVLLAVVPAIAVGAVQYGKFLKSLRKKFQDELADANTTAEESMSNIRTVRSFCGERKAVREYGEKIGKSFSLGRRIAVLQGVFQGGVNVMAFGAITCVLWYGGNLLYANTQDSSEGITAGVLTSFLLFTLNVAMGFAFVSALYGEFMQAVGASIRLFELLDREPKVNNQGLCRLEELRAEVAFDDVHFTYPARPGSEVLKGVSFKVDIGSMVALVGPSGGGKSTIVSLIERFYDTNQGNIILGGSNITTLDSDWFRHKIAIVSQEPVLFSCSIRDNITYGKEASIDEATSALDSESEYLVQEAIDRAMDGRTVLVIAHRLSTVKTAALVIVIDKGIIVEQGTHEDLLARNGVYRKLVLRQLTSENASLTSEPQVDEDNGKK